MNVVQPAFKVPESIPQDLLLIQGLIGEVSISPPTNLGKGSPAVKPEVEDDDISSSSSEDDSEDEVNEVEATLEVTEEEDRVPPSMNTIIPSDSSSESDAGSDSDSDSGDSKDDDMSPDKKVHDEYDDEESGPSVTTTTYFPTKNELTDIEITMPAVDEVGPDEVLEKVGEIISIVDNAVIVKGIATGFAGRVSEKALDSDTLLVFEDRTVLGYIYETFGPTYQPLYQVQFNQQYPLNRDKIQLSRQVFHLPNSSNFVFLSQLKKWKGSDASNVHDEEPADDEIEFSDDEEEAAFRSQRKRKRGESRGNSVSSSRHGTPTPSQMHDRDLIDESFGMNAYDERGPYDIDFSSGGPSRPAPIPYDDPYSSEYNAEALDADPAEPDTAGGSNLDDNRNGPRSPKLDSQHEMGRVRGRARGRGGQDRRDSRRDSGGRGGGRGRGWSDRGRGRGRGRGGRLNGDEDEIRRPTRDPYDAQMPRPLSPTSLAIARATGQLDGQGVSSNPGSMGQSGQMPMLPGEWQFQQPTIQSQQQFNFGARQPFVQPHINPRFASQFGIDFGLMQPQHYPQYGQNSFGSNSARSGNNWADEWIVHGGEAGGYGAGRDDAGTGSRSAGPS